MPFLKILSQLLFEPLTLLLELVYGTALNLMDSFGAAIIPLSLAVNFLLLPFYQRADAIQAEERDIQERMRAGLAHIKASFSGDERFMMQQEYYRQNHYKPIYSLRSVLPLALEIPFFITAYRFLSGIRAFSGQTFGLLLDLGKPDQMLTLGGVTLNALPILMTLINILSGELYTKGAPLKDKLTLHGMALIFLVLLYQAPSALVFYWTLNNLFSLVKNVIGRSKRPKLARRIAYSALGIASIAYAVIGRGMFTFGQLVFFLVGLLLQLPSMLGIIESIVGPRTAAGDETVGDTELFGASCVLLTVLTGLLIPTAVISSSPAEFMLTSNPHTPLTYVIPAALTAGGMFLLWAGLFYFLSTPRMRGAFTACAIVLAGTGLLDYLFFGTSMGTLLPLLQYEKTPMWST